MRPMLLDEDVCGGVHVIPSFLTSSLRFTPDFTQSRVSNTLRVLTSEGAEFLFPLLASLPHHALGACYAAQPRPSWEKQLARVAVPFWLVSLLLLVVLAFLHTTCGRSVYTAHSLPVAVDPVAQPTGGRVFDLKDIRHAACAAEKAPAVKRRWDCEGGDTSLHTHASPSSPQHAARVSEPHCSTTSEAPTLSSSHIHST